MPDSEELLTSNVRMTVAGHTNAALTAMRKKLTKGFREHERGEAEPT